MAVEHIQYEYEVRSGEAIQKAVEGKSNDFKPDLGVLAWLVLFGLGGGLLSMYYASVGYFPHVKWEESFSFLGLMAILGSFFVVLYAALLYVPGRIWCKFLISDYYLNEALSYKADRERPCLEAILRVLGLPFVVYSAILHAFLLAAVVLGLSRDLYGFLFLAGLLGLFIPTIHFYRSLDKKMLTGCARSLSRGDFNKHRLTLSGFFFFSLLSSFIAVWVINKTSISKVVGGAVEFGVVQDYIILAFVCTSMVLFVNVFVAITHSSEPRAALGVAALGGFVLLICGDLLVHSPEARFSARTLSRYGVGYSSSATLLVQEKACQLLKSEGVIGDLPCATAAPTKIEGVAILSRLGSEYFLCYNHRNFTLTKEDVLSWSAKPPDPSKNVSESSCRMP